MRRVGPPNDDTDLAVLEFDDEAGRIDADGLDQKLRELRVDLGATADEDVAQAFVGQLALAVGTMAQTGDIAIDEADDAGADIGDATIYKDTNEIPLGANWKPMVAA